MKAAGSFARGALGRPVTAVRLPAVARPKALAGRRLRPLAAAVLAIVLAVFLYPSQREAGFAVLVVLAIVAGWLFAATVAALVAAGEVAVVFGGLWFGVLTWPDVLLRAGILAALIGLAHVAAAREPVVHRSAAQQRRINGLTVLLETLESLASARDRDGILNIAVLASARGISRAADGRPAHAAFHSVVGEQLNISVVADAPVERDMALGFEYPLAKNQAARGAVLTGGPAFTRPDHMSGPLRELADAMGWKVLMMAPVYSRGSLQGMLAATSRDTPAVDPLQQYMLGTLARLTSLALDSSARMEELATAQKAASSEMVVPVVLPDIVDELRDAVKPIKSQILDLRAARNRGNDEIDDVAFTFRKLDSLIAALASRTAFDMTTGVLSRELGLAALERDVLRARRSQTNRHCVAVLHVATSEAPNGAELIRLVADRLRAGLRREDLIFRYADDEFVCSFADMDSADAAPVLSRIQTELAAEIGYTPFEIGLKSAGLEQTAG